MRSLAFALVAALLAGLGVLVPATTPAAFAATNPKVAIIVGATGGTTPTYRKYANQVYDEAIKYTDNVIKVYSPHATWRKVKAAVNGASIIVYMGHGNGWPAPYPYDPNFTTKDGFGLNYDLNGDGQLSDYENRYYGEPKIENLTPAPNAVVLLFHLCYASGNSEPGNANPTLKVAKERVDNYASAFLRAGAGVVIANGHSHDPYYIRALFTTHETLDQYWRNAPDFNDNVSSYASSRTPGATFEMDPESPGRYYRSITGDLSLGTADVTGAEYASTAGDPSTFVVPGNASPSTDSAPVYGSADAALAGDTPSATLATSDKVRIESEDVQTTADSPTVFQIHTDSGVDGWMLASDLVPRDSAAPQVWSVKDGSGAFSPNGDGSQDTLPVSVRLSEPSSWTLTLGADAGAQAEVVSGTGDTASGTWAPAAGSVPDGTHTWTLTASDAWGNTLNTDGTFVVDTQAPELTVGGLAADSIPLFTPNGDGVTDTVRYPVGSTEPGSVVATVRNSAATPIDTTSVAVGDSGATLAWHGRKTNGAYVADGEFQLSIVAVDLAGNASAPETRTVDAYGAAGFVASSRVLFFPQDGDRLARATRFSFQLLRPATVTWTIVNANGITVRTLKTDEALAAGSYGFRWNGRDDSGSYVPRGTYTSVVEATNGTLATTQSASVLVDAFRVSVSDATPARGQRLTITVTSAEPLSTTPRIAIRQPGISIWRVTTSRVSGRTYRVTIRLKSGDPGTVRLHVYARDKYGSKQGTTLRLPLS